MHVTRALHVPMLCPHNLLILATPLANLLVCHCKHMGLTLTICSTNIMEAGRYNMPDCLMLPNHEHPMLYSTYLCLIWLFMFKLHIYPLWQMSSCDWERKVQCSHLSLQRNRFIIAVNQQSATHYFAVTLPTHNNSEYIQGFSWVSLQL